MRATKNILGCFGHRLDDSKTLYLSNTTISPTPEYIESSPFNSDLSFDIFHAQTIHSLYWWLCSSRLIYRTHSKVYIRLPEAAMHYSDNFPHSLSLSTFLCVGHRCAFAWLRPTKYNRKDFIIFRRISTIARRTRQLVPECSCSFQANWLKFSQNHHTHWNSRLTQLAQTYPNSHSSAHRFYASIAVFAVPHTCSYVISSSWSNPTAVSA